MRMSPEGRRRLIQREGIRLHAYRDSVGIWTIGVGHTSAAGPPTVHPTLTITADECDAILTRDLRQYEKAIDAALRVPVAQHEYDALVSICFNVGPKFGQSTCIRKLNAGDRAGAAEAIMIWNKPPEIIGRRRTEYQQFKTPYRGLVQAKKPASKGGAVITGTIATGAVVAGTSAGLPPWAILLIVVGIGLVAFTIWRARK